MNIRFQAALDVRDGYGYITQELALALHTLDHNVQILPIKTWYSEQELTPLSHKLMKKNIPHHQVEYEMIIYHVNYDFHNVKRNSGIMTMWEANKLPSLWIKKLNTGPTNHILAPSEFVRDMFESSGVTKKINMLPLGIRTDMYPYAERTMPEKRPFRFLSLAKMEPRKNCDVLVDAFLSEFKDNRGVELIIKTRQGFVPTYTKNIASKNYNIKIIDTTMVEKDLIQLYYETDCFAYFSRGEGYSLPPRNALSSGMPVIVTGWSALSEIPGAVFVPVNTFSPMHPVGLSFGEEKSCHMADVSTIGAARIMRDVYDNYEKYAREVKTARDKLVTWDTTAERLVSIAKGN